MASPFVRNSWFTQGSLSCSEEASYLARPQAIWPTQSQAGRSILCTSCCHPRQAPDASGWGFLELSMEATLLVLRYISCFLSSPFEILHLAWLILQGFNGIRTRDLKLENLLRRSFFIFVYYRSSSTNYFIYTSQSAVALSWSKQMAFKCVRNAFPTCGKVVSPLWLEEEISLWVVHAIDQEIANCINVRALRRVSYID